MSRELALTKNLASKYNGAVATASTGGVNSEKLIDDTEATNWATLNQTTGVANTKPFVTVDLAGTAAQMVRSVQVSAMLRPADPNDSNDPGSQNRFTALRQFAIEICTQSSTRDCRSPLLAGTAGSPYERIYVSAADAFPGVAPRPLAPDLLLRTFDVPDRPATHVRLVALQNQCTGGPAYQGEQDNDPSNDTDCNAASNKDEVLRAAELEVFS